MWFKNARLFQVTSALTYQPESLANELQAFAFTPCLPTFAESLGWVSPLDSEAGPLVYAANGYMLIALQIEEKLLPASVVRQELDTKVKQIKEEEDRKVGRKEKQSLKDEILTTLRPKAFSRYSKIYAYFDTQKKLLVVDAASNSKIEKFTHYLKRSLPGLNFAVPDIQKPATHMTHWLQNKTVPGQLIIEKGCILQDPQQQNRVIRCQQQNLYARSIQELLKDGCEVKQLALSWDDQVNFNLTDEFVIRSIRFQDEVLAAAKEDYTETQDQQFDTDFVMMTETLSGLFDDLLGYFVKSSASK